MNIELLITLPTHCFLSFSFASFLNFKPLSLYFSSHLLSLSIVVKCWTVSGRWSLGSARLHQLSIVTSTKLFETDWVDKAPHVRSSAAKVYTPSSSSSSLCVWYNFKLQYPITVNCFSDFFVVLWSPHPTPEGSHMAYPAPCVDSLLSNTFSLVDPKQLFTRLAC